MDPGPRLSLLWGQLQGRKIPFRSPSSSRLFGHLPLRGGEVQALLVPISYFIFGGVEGSGAVGVWAILAWSF
jgi:hypothetical protein